MKNSHKIVVLTGAGISAESGLPTFRDAGGLWHGYDVMEVASLEGWHSNPRLVLDFYNQRRRQLLKVSPNKAHVDLAAFQSICDVSIITQNVDDLHERAGNRTVIHLHGELLKVCSQHDPSLIYAWKKDLKLGDCAEDGQQLRPAIVWFGELVPQMVTAIEEIRSADLILVVGTSLQVYPAATLITYAKIQVPIFYIDPAPALMQSDLKRNPLTTIAKSASLGVQEAITLSKTYLKNNL
jgi:NAD-dependent deacetylase